MNLTVATLTLQQVMMSWFLFYETPVPSPKQILPVLSSDVSITTPSSPETLRGLDACSARLSAPSTQDPELLNAHHVKNFEVLSADEQTIHAHLTVEYMLGKNEAVLKRALLNYDVLLEREGQTWRIKSLEAKVIEELPIEGVVFQDAFRPNSEALRKAQSEIAKTQPHPTEWNNRFLRFLHKWYWIFDIRPDASELAPLVAEEIEITMRGTFTNKAEYLSWYSEMRKIPMFNSHEVELVDVRSINGNTAVVDVYLRWQNQLEGGNLTSYLMRNTMTVVEDGNGNFQITKYVPRVLGN